MKITRRSLIGFGAGFAIAVTAGCGNQSTTTEAGGNETATSSEPSGEVNLYSSRHYDSDQELYDNFTKETGIKVNLIEGKAAELIERIESEGENSPADVLITVDVGNLWKAEQEGILQPVSSSVLESTVPANFRDSEGSWFALTKRARVIIYNKENVKPGELSTYEDLADPKWKGRICMRSSDNIYNQSLVASVVEKAGEEKAEEWLKGLVANFARSPEGNDVGQIKSVASGECDISLVNTYYVARLKQSDEAENQEIVEKIGVFFPNQEEEGTHVNISGAGVAVNAPNQENAVQFLEYLTTPEAQEVFANANNEYPVVIGAESNEVVEGLGEFQESSLDVKAYGEKNAAAVQLMDRAGWK
ncbi:Fe(3+) ABC transporter substrate-binding protein [Lusitaniella coriacea LEGE 07157]|uniref:Fe(3+) ABC transporter substrate-binding protein n=1 Tax=Lusitaniella coriacea LEGE 07157 TaxID=945747 RepID=A0A8J7B8X8_9CYAN|nr:Fe(3+) ABC transporter substrate-binding protein [Lusitaniella coriacea]MBE9115423.1 Fe(3+) ABC transporter substrate-binding protein [Lusitaniella coriacea LEGE 07157]